jgi:large subunit ribosomal protein L21
MLAVIKTGGKQYVVKEGDLLQVEKLGVEPGHKVVFDQVLLLDDGKQTLIGTPLVANAAVVAEVQKTFRDDKILVFKKKRRKQYRRTRGHRQTLTEVKIQSITADRASIPAEALKASEMPAPAPKAAAKPKAPKAPKTPAAAPHAAPHAAHKKAEKEPAKPHKAETKKEAKSHEHKPAAKEHGAKDHAAKGHAAKPAAAKSKKAK